METKRCPHCGETLPISSTFCPACFKELATEVAEPVAVSKKKNIKKPILFLWLGVLVLVVLFFIFLCVFSQGQQANVNPGTTFTHSPLSDSTSSADSAVPEFTLGTNTPSDTNVPSDTNAPSDTNTLSATNTQTQTVESVTRTPGATTNGIPTATPSFSFQIPTFFPFLTSSATTGNPATNTSTATNHRNTATATASKTPTPTKATATKTATATAKPTATTKPTTTVKPTATAKPTATPTPVIDESLFAYTVSDGKATITDYYGADAIVYVPSALGGYPVTVIDEFAFSNLNGLKEVYIMDGITTIGKEAFFYCENLEKVHMADSITEIGQSAFASNRKLYDVHLSANLVTISSSGFSNCKNLKEITFPDGLQYIGSNSFTGCSITKARIPASVKSMDFAFLWSETLESIDVDSGNATYYSVDGVLFKKIYDSIHELIVYPACKKDTSYTVPAVVKEIFTAAFANNTYLKNVTLSPQMHSIGSSAFLDCTALTSVKTYSYLEVIGDAFENCTNLTTMNLESSVTTINKDAFSGCNNLTLTVVKDSYAHTYAESNNIAYILK